MIPIDISTIIQSAFINAISGLVQNIFYVIVLIWAIKFLGKKMSDLKKSLDNFMKNIPSYLSQYEDIKIKERRIDFARSSRT